MDKWFSLMVYLALFVCGYLVGWLIGRKAAREEARLLFNLADRLLTHVLREKMNFKDPLRGILKEVQDGRKTKE